MTATELSPEDVAKQQHQDWLNHPSTAQMFKILKHQEEFNVSAIAGQAGNTTDDSFFHRCAMNIKTLRSVKEWCSNTDKFIELASKQQKN